MDRLCLVDASSPHGSIGQSLATQLPAGEHQTDGAEAGKGSSRSSECQDSTSGNIAELGTCCGATLRTQGSQQEATMWRGLTVLWGPHSKLQNSGPPAGQAPAPQAALET